MYAYQFECEGENIFLRTYFRSTHLNSLEEKEKQMKLPTCSYRTSRTTKTNASRTKPTTCREMQLRAKNRREFVRRPAWPSGRDYYRPAALASLCSPTPNPLYANAVFRGVFRLPLL